MPTLEASRDIATLLAIMKALREPGGCPWDREQTLQTIAPYTVEEAYEVASAIEDKDWKALPGELGDLLFQVVFHARMAEEAGLFDFGDVVEAITTKMIRRHPHVFGSEDAKKSAEEQKSHWENLKAEERKAKALAGVLDDVPAALPALMRAEKLQKRASSVGFDWNNAQTVVDKIAEEAREVTEAQTEAERKEELGDLLFVIANLARHLKVDPEAALRAANAKFVRRFHHIEAMLAARGSSPAMASLEEMEALWQQAKAKGIK
ncbi:MAG: nucleoside triphosphate pyrophosphohydrolase [Alphaproteobacteria bacterium]|nr:nucleoside triphosphate pyrophosphohydrolase [Alphaproteobacteria bacterium]